METGTAVIAVLLAVDISRRGSPGVVTFMPRVSLFVSSASLLRW
jgi:hypothetical protein